ncbi:MAG TPA: c-type cytochrome [Nitrospiraceae bacterium]|nr:c-type cytochrome [Nitrospiraceae bacterium]
MAEQPSLIKSIIKKGVLGVIVGAVLAGVANALTFPPVFQVMFFTYAMLGTAVFILLDAPSVTPVSGLKALVVLVVFYIVISGVYIGGASLWPQYDPEDEKGKIEKLLKAKRAATEQGKAEELLARAKALSEKADAIMQRLQAVGGNTVAEGPPGMDSARPSSAPVAAGDLAALGRQQWDLQECYNCHKLEGKGGKKRGPELDNIGNLMKPEELRQKVLDPRSWMAEGFEKEYEKKKMPDKYKDLMEEKEVDALVAFLSTLKNTSVNTPKPVKKK